MPMVLFLLYERWREAGGSEDDFQEAAVALGRREEERAEQSEEGSRVGNDCWAWPGSWLERHSRPRGASGDTPRV